MALWEIHLDEIQFHAFVANCPASLWNQVPVKLVITNLTGTSKNIFTTSLKINARPGENFNPWILGGYHKILLILEKEENH